MTDEVGTSGDGQHEQPWYARAWVTVALLVLLFPAGIFLLWRYQSWALWVKLAATGSSLFFAAYIIFGSPLYWF